MSAVHRALSDALAMMRIKRMHLGDLDDVLNIENDVYPFPWTRGNFLDSLYSGYEMHVVRDGEGRLAGYFLLMIAVDEAHLLNITVRRDLHGYGIGRVLLDEVVRIAREKSAASVLLEVRPSNSRALHIYKKYGFSEIGRRKAYYPAAANTREDAIVMRINL